MLDVQRLAVITRNTEFDELQKIFIDCDVAKAEATVIADRDRILEEISKTMPFAEMNKNIKTALVESARIEVKRAISTHGEHSIHIANPLVKFTRMLSFVGKYEEGQPFIQQALAIREKELGLEHPDTATAIHYLAGLLDDLGKREEAKVLYEQCLAIREKVYGVEHPSIAKTLNNLAALTDSMRNYEDAAVLYQRCIAIQEKLIGSEHPDTATILGNYGLLLGEMNHFEESEEMLLKALAIQEKVLIPEHPSIANTLTNLAGLFRQIGKREQAKIYYQRALAIFEKVLGDHPTTALVLNRIGQELQLFENYDEAVVYYQRSYDIQLKVLGSEHPETVNALQCLNDSKMFVGMGKVEALDMSEYEAYQNQRWNEEDDSNFVALMTRLMKETPAEENAEVEADSNVVNNSDDVKVNSEDVIVDRNDIAALYGWK